MKFDARVSTALHTDESSDVLGHGSCACGARWFGLLICHCAACHLTFGSVTGFDAHRDGVRGACRGPDELRARGLDPNDKGHWRRPRPLDTIPSA